MKKTHGIHQKSRFREPSYHATLYSISFSSVALEFALECGGENTIKNIFQSWRAYPLLSDVHVCSTIYI